MNRTFIILLFSIFTLSLEGPNFAVERELDFQQKVCKFVNFIKDTDLFNMYNHIYHQDKWPDAVNLIDYLVPDYPTNEDDEDEEDIDEYANHFCLDKALQVPRTSLQSCNDFIKEFYNCIRYFPYCHGKKIKI